MSKSFSLEQLADYIADNLEKIGAVRQEMAEIQVGFNSAYVEWKAEHDASLERLVQAIDGRSDEVGPELQARIGQRCLEESELIEKRRQELRQELIPTAQAEADAALEKGQSLAQALRKLNPELDQREEGLKARRARLEAELGQLNQQISRLSGCLGVVVNFPKITRLDRQRQRLIGRLEGVNQALKEVRQQWQTAQQQTGDEQATLQAGWQDLTLKLAQLQAELSFLDDEANRQATARQRAVRHVVDHLKEPVAPGQRAGGQAKPRGPLPDLQGELDEMVKLNVQTDDYQAALGAAASLLSLLDGISEGLKRFDRSVQGTLDEQKMHSAYLPMPEVSLREEVLGFHAQWDDLRSKVRDERHLSAHPAEFVAAVGPVMQEGLSEARIKAMFEGLGQALDAATRGWRKG